MSKKFKWAVSNFKLTLFLTKNATDTLDLKQAALFEHLEEAVEAGRRESYTYSQAVRVCVFQEPGTLALKFRTVKVVKGVLPVAWGNDKPIHLEHPDPVLEIFNKAAGDHARKRHQAGEEFAKDPFKNVETDMGGQEIPPPHCLHPEVVYDNEQDNFYCKKCYKGMGLAYYKVAKELMNRKKVEEEKDLAEEALRVLGNFFENTLSAPQAEAFYNFLDGDPRSIDRIMDMLGKCLPEEAVKPISSIDEDEEPVPNLKKPCKRKHVQPEDLENEDD